VNIQFKHAPQIAAVLTKGADKISSLMFGTRSTKTAVKGDVIIRAQKLMAERLPAPIKMEELAASLHVGYSWFRKEFKRQTGVSPNEHYLMLKIERIKELLTTTKLSASEIASMLNFSSSHYMSNLFKQKTGQTPGQYRSDHL